MKELNWKRRLAGLENRNNRTPALWLTGARFVNVLTAFALWFGSWGFRLPDSPPRLATAVFVVAILVYTMLLLLLIRWRRPAETLFLLLFVDLAAVTGAVLNTGGIGSPLLLLFLFPLMAVFFYDNQWLIELSVGGAVACLGVVLGVHVLGEPTVLIGPDLQLATISAWQVPVVVVLLVVVFAIARRSVARHEQTAVDAQSLKQRLNAANEELTRSFYDLESALDGGRANQEYARNAQQLLLRAERFSAVGKLAAGVLHDMTNPLSIMISDGEMFFLKIEDSPDRAKKTIKRMLDNAQRLSRLIDNLRLLTKQHSDAIHGAVDVNDIVMRSLAALEPERKRRGVVAEPVLDKTLPKMLGVESRIEQLVFGLLVNAFEAIDHPGGRVVVRTRSAGGKLVLEVEDDGQGIAPQHLDRVFEAFFSTRGDSISLGLGLYAARAIVEEHKGTITVRSEPEVSTMFTVQLPFQPEHHE